jgi:hypothetical protein
MREKEEGGGERERESDDDYGNGDGSDCDDGGGDIMASVLTWLLGRICLTTAPLYSCPGKGRMGRTGKRAERRTGING